MKNQIIIN